MIAEMDIESGLWVYKADNIGPFKKKGGLKSQYRDLPRYNVIYEWEEDTKKEYEKTLKEGIREIIKKLANKNK